MAGKGHKREKVAGKGQLDGVFQEYEQLNIEETGEILLGYHCFAMAKAFDGKKKWGSLWFKWKFTIGLELECRAMVRKEKGIYEASRNLPLNKI